MSPPQLMRLLANGCSGFDAEAFNNAETAAAKAGDESATPVGSAPKSIGENTRDPPDPDGAGWPQVLITLL